MLSGASCFGSLPRLENGAWKGQLKIMKTYEQLERCVDNTQPLKNEDIADGRCWRAEYPLWIVSYEIDVVSVAAWMFDVHQEGFTRLSKQTEIHVKNVSTHFEKWLHGAAIKETVWNSLILRNHFTGFVGPCAISWEDSKHHALHHHWRNFRYGLENASHLFFSHTSLETSSIQIENFVRFGTFGARVNRCYSTTVPLTRFRTFHGVEKIWKKSISRFNQDLI